MTLVPANPIASLVSPRQPGAPVVYEGWCEQTILPWLDATEDVHEMRRARAALAGLAKAYGALRSDTFELELAMRYTELRIGELLPEAERGGDRTSQSARERFDDGLERTQRHKYRQMAAAREAVVEYLQAARSRCDPELVSQRKLLAIAREAAVRPGDWYTGAKIIDAVRACFAGSINLDPASSAEANEVVKAERFYSIDEDGLTKPWSGTVWLNPPFNQWQDWTPRILSEWRRGEVEQMCVLIANRSLSTSPNEKLLRAASALCVTTGRIPFWGPRVEACGHSSPDDGHTILYFGKGTTDDFSCAFEPGIGTVLGRPRRAPLP